MTIDIDTGSVDTIFEKLGDKASISTQLLLLLLVLIWDGVVLMADLLFLYKADPDAEGVIAFDGGLIRCTVLLILIQFNAVRSTILVILSNCIENGFHGQFQGLRLLVVLNIAAVKLGPGIGWIVDRSPPYVPIA